MPNAPTNLAMTSVTTSTVDVTWTIPAGNYDGYFITLKTSDFSDVTETVTKGKTTYQFTGVLPAQTYTVSLKATVGSGDKVAESDEVNLQVHTRK